MRGAKAKKEDIREKYMRFNHNFEHREAQVDKEIEQVLQYFTPDIRKNMVDMDNILRKVEQNEIILKSRQTSRQSSVHARSLKLPLRVKKSQFCPKPDDGNNKS